MTARRIVMARVMMRVGVVVALLVAVLGGWLWGASGRWAIERALQAAESRSDLVEARAALLDARVSLCDGDYGATSRHLANAKRFIGRACDRLDTLGSCDDLLPQLNLRGVGTQIDRARRLAATLGRGASVAADAQEADSPADVIEKR